MSDPLQPIAAAAFERFDEVHVAVVASDPRVALPARFEGLDRVVLRFEPRNSRNVQNLALEPYGITALMSFDGAPFTVRVPWGAIAAIMTPVYVVQAKTTTMPPTIRPSLRIVK